MSAVDNVILSIGCEDCEEVEYGDRYLIMDKVNAWLKENAGGQSFGPELSECRAAYGGHKTLEATVFVGAFNYMPEDAFFAFLVTLPWRFPEDVQYIVMREQEDQFSIITLADMERNLARKGGV